MDGLFVSFIIPIVHVSSAIASQAQLHSTFLVLRGKYKKEVPIIDPQSFSVPTATTRDRLCGVVVTNGSSTCTGRLPTARGSVLSNSMVQFMQANILAKCRRQGFSFSACRSTPHVLT